MSELRDLAMKKSERSAADRYNRLVTGTECLSAESLRDRRVFTEGWRAALASLADPEVVRGIAEVLAEHEGQGEVCWGCGATREPRPGAPWSGWHAHHQAEAVVAALR